MVEFPRLKKNEIIEESLLYPTYSLHALFQPFLTTSEKGKEDQNSEDNRQIEADHNHSQSKK